MTIQEITKKLRLSIAIFLSLLLSVSYPQTVLGQSADSGSDLDKFLYCEIEYVLYSCADECADTPPGISRQVGDGDGDSGGCGGTTDENKNQIWNYLRGQGLSEAATAGLMGNFEKESTFNPKAVNPIGCIGIAQWCDRGPDLREFAALHGNGRDWDCLSVQLEFLWYEMTETKQGNMTAPSNSRNPGDQLEIPLVDALNGASFEKRSIYDNLNVTEPYVTALIFHDYFERANTNAGEDKGRGEAAEKLFLEFTGQNPLTASPTNATPGGSNDSCAGTTGNFTTPNEECAALIAAYRELEAQGKIRPETDWHKQNNDKDLENCTTDQITCGTGGGIGGVHPRILRAVVDAAGNSGASELVTWSYNTGHGCDGLNHPRGMAIDIQCDGNTGTSKGGNTGRGATEDCNKLFIYFYDHYDELGLTELIWQYPPAGYPCDDPKILCNIAGHTDHIHVGTRVR
tara:strand:+ start:22870 stop:24243 length:1374 start_codon:yes stop_codon:yes gene_type:complete